MKIFEIVFCTGETRIVFGESRTQIRRKWEGFGISAVNRVVIH
jgi:hypothetical protein